MKKLLAYLLSLTMLSVPAMQVSAIEYDENGEIMGDIDIVVGSYIVNYTDGSSYEYCYLNNGCVISPHVISDDITLEYGDVIWVHASSIDPMWPGRYAEIIEIEYLGKADEYYGTTKELTVVKIGDSRRLEDEQGNIYGWGSTCSCKDLDNLKSEFDIDDFNIGDKAIFVMNDDKVVLPIEITYKAEQEDTFININPVPSDVVTGDANGDTELDILDVIAINKAVLGKEEFTEQQKKSADINNDGIVDANDSLMLMKHIVGLVDILNLA